MAALSIPALIDRAQPFCFLCAFCCTLDTGCGLRQDVPNTAPVWLSEIGLTVQQFDPADGSADDTRWWRCLRAWMARHDIDWGFWALQV